MDYLRQHQFISLVLGISLIGAVLFGYTYLTTPPTPLDSFVVETGIVEAVVAVSGVVEAEQQARLTFPTSGIITGIFVDDGSSVEVGDIIATLSTSTILAERNEAQSALLAAQAQLQQAIDGPRSETIAVATTKKINAEAQRERITREETARVDNARRALLSDSLSAVTDDPEEKAVPPVISGSYRCEAEGDYTISLYAANSESGYAYNLRGLENGVYEASALQPTPLGQCGLFIRIDPTSTYGDTTWTVSIPNKRSLNYQTLQNTYTLTKTEAENRIRAATDAVTLAEQELALTGANTESTVIRASEAAVLQAQARVDAIDTRLRDRSIIAPFAGVVAESDITIGEAAGTEPRITLVGRDRFTVKARVPEIDITKIAPGQAVTMSFDAKTDTIVMGEVSYISPIAVTIDGVAYFTVTITLNEIPDWIRSGLNTDIDITTKSTTTTRVPTRFITPGTPGLLVRTGSTIATTTITIEYTGTDGYSAIQGIAAGSEVIAP